MLVVRVKDIILSIFILSKIYFLFLNNTSSWHTKHTFDVATCYELDLLRSQAALAQGPSLVASSLTWLYQLPARARTCSQRLMNSRRESCSRSCLGHRLMRVHFRRSCRPSTAADSSLTLVDGACQWPAFARHAFAIAAAAVAPCA